MVRGIYVEPDVGHSHDPYSEAAFHSESCVRSGDFAHNAGITVLTIIPFTVFGTMLGFVALPATYFAYLIPCILVYMILATSLKKAYVRHFGELL